MSFQAVNFADIEASRIPLSVFIMRLGIEPRDSKDWKRRGIPQSLQPEIHKFLVERGIRDFKPKSKPESKSKLKSESKSKSNSKLTIDELDSVVDDYFKQNIDSKALTDSRHNKTNKIKELDNNSAPYKPNKINNLGKKYYDFIDSSNKKLSEINNIGRNPAPLVTIGVFASTIPHFNVKTFAASVAANRSKFAFLRDSLVKTNHNFKFIKQFKPPFVNPDDLALVFDSVDLRIYRHESGEEYHFQRRGMKSVKNKDGGFKRVEKWVHVKTESDLVTDKYQLQSTARYICAKPLFDKGFPLDCGSYLSVCTCHRNVKAGVDTVQIMRSFKHQSIFYAGLMTCGSVWQCPVCAPKISARRAVELGDAMTLHKARGGVVAFVTRTVPHTDRDSCNKILSQFQTADGKMTQTRKYKDLMQAWGVIGKVKAFELTVGRNGWHIHTHEIFFFESQAAVDAAAGLSMSFDAKDQQRFLAVFENEFYSIWKHNAVKAGFDEPSEAHGLQVQNGDFAAAYVAKYGKEKSSDWDAENEMTSFHRKNSKSGLSPFDLIRQYDATGDQLYADLFFEFAYTMAKRRARQLRWSPGLKKYFAIEEKIDEEIAEEQVDEAEALGSISREQWKVIVRLRQRAYPLNILRASGVEGLANYLVGIDLIISRAEMFGRIGC